MVFDAFDVPRYVCYWFYLFVFACAILPFCCSSVSNTKYLQFFTIFCRNLAFILLVSSLLHHLSYSPPLFLLSPSYFPPPVSPSTISYFPSLSFFLPPSILLSFFSFPLPYPLSFLSFLVQAKSISAQILFNY